MSPEKPFLRFKLWLLLFCGIGLQFFFRHGRSILVPLVNAMSEPRPISDVIEAYGQSANACLAPSFETAHIPFPPRKIALLAFKAEKQLELWACANDTSWVHIKTYSILAASGSAGPKLRQGDLQV